MHHITSNHDRLSYTANSPFLSATTLHLRRPRPLPAAPMVTAAAVALRQRARRSSSLCESNCRCGACGSAVLIAASVVLPTCDMCAGAAAQVVVDTRNVRPWGESLCVISDMCEIKLPRVAGWGRCCC
jgi:hypothetical protein